MTTDPDGSVAGVPDQSSQPGPTGGRRDDAGAVGAWAGDDLRTAWEEHRRYVAFSAVLFVLGVPVGAGLWARGVDLLALLGADGFEEVFPGELTVATLLLNNTRVFALLVIGALTGGLLSGGGLVFNGVFVGYVAAPLAVDAGVGFVLVGILPHGVPELLAFFVAAGVGFRIVRRAVDRLVGRSEVVLGRDGWRRVGVLLAAAWLLLAVAAVLEVHVTAALLGLL